jgi:hypothetical protein
MLFAKTVLLAILGLGSMAFAIPVEATADVNAVDLTAADP